MESGPSLFDLEMSHVSGPDLKGVGETGRPFARKDQAGLNFPETSLGKIALSLSLAVNQGKIAVGLDLGGRRDRHEPEKDQGR